ncbi:TetR/AcrR family transcriptional regulator [Demequina sp. B12]|uniref:TetR/AcrR family transcriptional regulator n=1 Tax=Demequina sp. B12 TaxID=2992757 RepID=UPI00237B272C|nr:TetR/AcrR family transcriptional regulator [Demequina sp. B12]MDE0572301.1 TetR/AcrR family transcriptional regulator [Demequina sp. B12]
MVETAPTAKRGTARERLLRAAEELFYCEGINTTGVEAIAARAGVTKATLYNNFRSKDQLVAEYLRGKLEKSRAAAHEYDDPHAPASARVAALFEDVERTIEQGDFHGCPFTKAAVEVPGNADAMAVVREHYADIVGHLTAVTGDAASADTIAMIYDGAMIAAKASGDAAPIARAKTAAVGLLDPR